MLYCTVLCCTVLYSIQYIIAGASNHNDISSPPVPSDGPTLEAQQAAGRGEEGGGGDEDRHQGPGDQTEAAGDDDSE